MATMLRPEGLSDEELEELTAERIEGEALSRDFRSFIPAAWSQIETAPFIPGFHIDAIADHLEAVTYGEIKKLIINIPPGCSKSLTCSVLWPAWEWGFKAWIRWFYASYDLDLALRDARKTRDLIRSDWYQARWPVAFKGDQDAKGRYETTEGGWRISQQVCGHGTGEHPHRNVTDDPLSREKAASATELQAIIDWNDLTMATRGAALKVSHVIVMQRLAPNDLSGHCIARERGYVHLCLPMRYEPKRMVTTPLGWNDPRKPGELLAPKQFDEATVRQMEKTLGTMGAAGQLQQRPAAEGGNIIKKDWLRFWQPAGEDFGPVRIEGREYLCVPLPKRFDQVIQSWDTSYKDELGQVRKGKLPDPVAGGALGRLKTAIYLLDGVNDVMDVIAAAKAVRTMTAKYPHAKPRLIEDRANGPAIMAWLRSKGISSIPITPRGSKESRVREAAPDQKSKDARSMSMAAMIEAGDFYLPHPGMPGFAWVLDLIVILCAFPNVEHDDWVDMLSQAFGWFARFIDREALEAAADEHDGEPPKTLAEAVKREDRKREEEEDEELASDYNGSGDDGPAASWFR